MFFYTFFTLVLILTSSSLLYSALFCPVLLYPAPFCSTLLSLTNLPSHLPPPFSIHPSLFFPPLPPFPHTFFLYSLSEHMMKRLRDEDVDVRLGALSRLLELGAESSENLSVSTYKEMGKRLSDRKIEVRKLAVVGLSRLYLRHISSNLPSISTLINNEEHSSQYSQGRSQDENIDSSLSLFSTVLKKGVLDKLGFVPGFVVNTWGYVEMRHLVLQLLQENILPK